MERFSGNFVDFNRTYCISDEIDARDRNPFGIPNHCLGWG